MSPAAAAAAVNVRLAMRIMYFSWALSPDGSSVAICEPSETGTNILILSLRRKTVRDIKLPDWRGFQSIQWTADGTGLFLMMSSDNSSTILKTDLSGATRIVFQKSRDFYTVFAPSPDGKWLLFSEYGSTSNVSLLSGF